MPFPSYKVCSSSKPGGLKPVESCPVSIIFNLLRSVRSCPMPRVNLSLSRCLQQLRGPSIAAAAGHHFTVPGMAFRTNFSYSSMDSLSSPESCSPGTRPSCEMLKYIMPIYANGKILGWRLSIPLCSPFQFENFGFTGNIIFLRALVAIIAAV